ncbi:TIGR02221 family CRISPR-associated protein [Calditrichota bacterium GD2]
MGKKFLSFLGTNNYLRCSYYFNSPKEEFYFTRFVQTSILRRLHMDKILDGNSKILIFTTKSAIIQNWQDTDRGEGLDSALKKLKKELKTKGIDFAEYDKICIPEGKSEQELWEIFEEITFSIDEGDNLYVDITHSFRSLPLMMVIILNYLRVLKNIKIQKIYYGAFEVLGPVNALKDKKNEELSAPIFDLTPFIDLFYWTTAAHDFIQTGNAKMITELTRRNIQPLFTKNSELRKDATMLNDLSKKIKSFSQEIQVANAKRLPNVLDELSKSLQEADRYTKVIPPLHNLFGKVSETFKPFSSNLSIIEKINFAIRFCFDHGLIQQGYTMLEENFISYGCLYFNLNHESSDYRMIFGSALTIKEKQIEENEWQYKGKNLSKEEERKIIKQIISHDLDNFIQLKSELSNMRNTLNHAGFRNHKIKYQTYLKKAYNLLDKFEELINETK